MTIASRRARSLTVQDLVILGSLSLAGGITVTGNATVNGSLAVNGNATLGNAAGDNHTVNGTLTAVNNVNIQGNLDCDNDVILGTNNTDTLTVNSVSTFVNNAAFGDDVSILNDLTVTSGNALVSTGGITATLGGIRATAGQVRGATMLSDGAFATTNGAITAGGALGDVIATHDVSCEDFAASGNAAVSGTFAVNGNATIGNAPGDAHTINGTVLFAQNVTMQAVLQTDSLNVVGAIDTQSTLTVAGLFTANGSVVLGNNAADTIAMYGEAGRAQIAAIADPTDEASNVVATSALLAGLRQVGTVNV